MLALKRILVPVDFSACSRAAVDYALLLAERLGAALDILHVWEPPQPVGAIEGAPPAAEWRGQTRAQMAEFIEPCLRGHNTEVRTRHSVGDPYRTILDVATEGYDLLVMGTHGRTGVSHFLLGSLAESVVRRAPCPVLTVREETIVKWEAQIDHSDEISPHRGRIEGGTQ